MCEKLNIINHWHAETVKHKSPLQTGKMSFVLDMIIIEMVFVMEFGCKQEKLAL